MKKHFSLVEILIATIVAFLALTILIAFFPSSFKRSETTQQKVYASQASTQFINHLKAQFFTYPIPNKLPAASYQVYSDEWDASISLNPSPGDSDPLPSTKTDKTFISQPPNQAPPSLTSADEGIKISQHSEIKSLYLIKSITDIDGAPVVDNAIEARIWKSPYVSSNNLGPKTGTNQSKYTVNDYSKAVRINIEFSWPTYEPYATRTKKSYYFMDLVK